MLPLRVYSPKIACVADVSFPFPGGEIERAGEQVGERRSAPVLKWCKKMKKEKWGRGEREREGSYTRNVFGETKIANG